MRNLKPSEIVNELDRHIIGQVNAKRAVAIALRNRWRRMNIEDEGLRREIMPKNILMIGPTGVGKTEIARRLARLAEAPFIKVEATKFTEVGYVGRDVESIVRDLVDIAIKQEREIAQERVVDQAHLAAEERLLDILLPPARDAFKDEPTSEGVAVLESKTRQRFREKLRAGELDDKEVEINVAVSVGLEIMAPPGMEEMTNQLTSMFRDMSMGSDRKKMRKMKVPKALKELREEESSKLINEEDIKARAIENAEQNGIIFIDEIDKVAKSTERSGGDVSREGVQRDLLPLVEGTTVSTKHGMIKSDHMLFIASGAFHVAKPSDLIAELQGRLPIRVELSALSIEDFERILREPDASLTEQSIALLATEKLPISFSDDGIHRIATIAWQINDRTENIGARRLYTVMERLLEVISFDPETAIEKTENLNAEGVFVIDASYVDKQLGALIQNEDLSRYIL